MNIVGIAENDLEFTLEDKDNGFGVDITITNKNGIEYPVVGQSLDIGFSIDPGTGESVAGGTAEVSIRLSTLATAGAEVPARGWKVRFSDTNGNVLNYAVEDRQIDKKLGSVKLILGKMNVS